MVKNRKLLVALAIIFVLTIPRVFLVAVRTVDWKYFEYEPPDELKNWRAESCYVCDLCLKELENPILRRESRRKGMNVWYFEWALEDGKCPFHKDQELRKTTNLPINPITREVLPADTEILEKIYIGGGSESKDRHFIDLSIVTSGKDKRSIHRAERCLTMQGWRVKGSRTITISTPDAKTKALKVTRLVLELHRRSENGKMTTSYMVAFYWFLGKERITENHFKRIGYMAWDRMALGKNYRWSYVLMTSRVRKSVTETTRAMMEFVSELWPAIERRSE